MLKLNQKSAERDQISEEWSPAEENRTWQVHGAETGSGGGLRWRLGWLLQARRAGYADLEGMADGT